MSLKAYEDFEPEPLAFPIRGKTYTPPPISAKTGLTLVKALAGDPELVNKEARSLWQLVLGPTYDEMIADDVPLDALARAGFAMLADWQADRDAAVRVWESGIDPEVRAALAAAMRDGSTTSPSTAAAGSSTRRQASTSGTNSRKTRAARSGGKNSSNTGR